MAYAKKGRKFGRKSSQRIALMRSLSRSLILQEKIVTTEAKAKSLRPYIERMITKGKTNTLAQRRLLISQMGNDKESIKKLLETISPRYKDRKGGYTRIIKIFKPSHNMQSRAIIEFV